jgi:cytoskeleton protein RodZ
MAEIGATLREARMRARIDVSEIEAQTKIRAKYLRALENEEWDLLPGPTFVRSFLRTYAQALGLDDKSLVDEYRLRFEQPVEFDHQPVVSSARNPRRRPPARKGRRPSRGYAIALGAVGLLIVLLIVGLLSGKGGGSPSSSKVGGSSAGSAQTRTQGRSNLSQSRRSTVPVANARVALSLRPSAPVYVCLIGDNGRKVIPGLIIQPPYTPVTYHAKHFEITLGNNAITMYVDGKLRTVPASSRAVGYTITSAGRHTLASAQQPTCK